MVSATAIVEGTMRFLRQHLVDILKWSAVYLVITLAMALVMRPMMERFSGFQPGIRAVPAASFFVMFAIFWVALMAVFLVLMTATMRAALRPEERAFAYLRVGADELRMLGLGLALLAIFVGFYLAIVLVTVALVAAARALGTAAAIGAVIVVIPIVLGIFPALIFCWVRLSISVPLTLWRRKIVIGEAWRMTRGHFWSLFGGYFLVMLIVYIVMLPLFMISAAPMMAAMMHAGSDPQAMQQLLDAQAARQAAITPFNIVMIVVSALFGGFAIAAQGGMLGTALLGLLTEKGEVGLAEIFGGEPVATAS